MTERKADEMRADFLKVTDKIARSTTDPYKFLLHLLLSAEPYYTFELLFAPVLGAPILIFPTLGMGG